MNELPKSLLIGNGLNQCLQGGLPWGNLLENIAKEFGIEPCIDIPFPLEFERVINVYLNRNPKDAKDIYNRVKKEIAGLFVSFTLPDNAIHKEISKIKAESLITTNYDLLLEKVFDDTFITDLNKGTKNNSTKYLFEPVGKIDEIDFFHAHGCAVLHKTICLGYEHYMGIVQNIRERIKPTKNGNYTNNIIAVLSGKKEHDNTWMEKFYTTNMEIIGLGMYECESDLWWLLTHRASLFYSDESGNHSFIKNVITYHDIIDDLENESNTVCNKKKNSETYRKHKLLEGLNVVVKKYYLSNTSTGKYQEAYKKIIEEIAKNE